MSFLKRSNVMWSAVLFLVLGVFVVSAAPPTSQYRPAETLDPTCSPGDANCSVSPLNLGQAIGANASGTSPTSGGLFFASASSTFTQNASLLWNTLTDHLNLTGAGLDMTVASSSLSIVATTTLNDPLKHLFVDAGVAYLTSISNPDLYIVDVNDPNNPTIISQTNFPSLTNLAEIVVIGDYLYSTGNQGLTVLDISDKTNPLLLVVEPNFGKNYGIALSGSIVYGVDDAANSLHAIDISDPRNPVGLDEEVISTNPSAIDVRGNFAYVGDYSSGEMSIVDVSDPRNLEEIANVDIGAFISHLRVSGSYVYALERNSDELVSIDVSDPNSPAEVDRVTVGDQPRWFDLAGGYAYVVNQSSDDMYVVDVSDPSDMAVVGVITVGESDYDAFRVHVAGDYAYVTGRGSAGGLTIINLSGLTTHAAEIGSLETGSLNVNDGAHFAKQVYIDSGLNVGSGILTNGNLSVAPESGSTTAMSIYTAPGSQGDILNLFASTTEVMTVTSSGYLGLGTTAPSTTIHMTGAHTLIETSTTPTNPTQSAEARMYVKDDKFIIQFNDAGTVRYKYLDLTGTGATWTATTTAP